MLFLTIFILFPLFLSKKVFNDNILRNFTILIIVICSVFAVIDHKVKKSPELYKYTEFLDAMIPILNYGYAQKLIANRDIPIKYGYSTNDLNLLASYFYITDKFTDTAVISKMIEELGASERINISEGISALKAFLHPSLLPLIILGMALLLLLPRQRNNSLKIISCLCLAFGCFFFIGAFGRPGRVRIMFPIAMAILLLPLMSVYIIEYKHKIVILLISLILCIYTFTYIHSKVINNTLLYSKACQYIIKLPIDEPIFSWGHAFPFEAVQPVLQGWPTNIDIRFFCGYTSSPFDKATNGGGGEFLDKMRSIEGVLTLDKGDRCEKFLKTFAQEYNFGCRVSCENEGRILPDTKIVRVRCK
jgi:hypothetical protein